MQGRRCSRTCELPSRPDARARHDAQVAARRRSHLRALEGAGVACIDRHSLLAPIRSAREPLHAQLQRSPRADKQRRSTGWRLPSQMSAAPSRRCRRRARASCRSPALPSSLSSECASLQRCLLGTEHCISITMPDRRADAAATPAAAAAAAHLRPPAAAAAGWGLTAAWAAKTPLPSSAGTCWMHCRRSWAERGRARRSRRVVLRLASSLLAPSAVPVGCCTVLAAHDRHHRSRIALSSSPSTCCMTQALAEKAATHQLLLQCLSDCGAFQRLHASVLR